MSHEEQRQNLLRKIHEIEHYNFENVALQVFKFQVEHNVLYKEYLKLLNINIKEIDSVFDIPFLPIQFFKTHLIKTGSWTPQAVFSSSGTTSETTSQHQLRSELWYRKNARKIFQSFYSSPKDFCFLALLPSYLEREGSSLIFMVEDFIAESKYRESGFFLNNFEALISKIKDLKKRNIPIVLWGVTFALLDLAELYSVDLEGVIVMETGGMKGRRKEVTRIELHEILTKNLNVKTIHSEYGMTELLSQAYSKGEGIFHPADTMKMLTREITDPLKIQKNARTGAINIIDLANIDTCSFIATDDLGKVFEDGSFEILGRLDASDIRGCNLLIQ